MFWESAFKTNPRAREVNHNRLFDVVPEDGSASECCASSLEPNDVAEVEAGASPTSPAMNDASSSATAGVRRLITESMSPCLMSIGLVSGACSFSGLRLTKLSAFLNSWEASPITPRALLGCTDHLYLQPQCVICIAYNYGLPHRRSFPRNSGSCCKLSGRQLPTVQRPYSILTTRHCGADKHH